MDQKKTHESPPSPQPRTSMIGSAFNAVKNYFTPEKKLKTQDFGITPLAREFASLTINDSTQDSYETSQSLMDDSFKSTISHLELQVNGETSNEGGEVENLPDGDANVTIRLDIEDTLLESPSNSHSPFSKTTDSFEVLEKSLPVLSDDQSVAQHGEKRHQTCYEDFEVPKKIKLHHEASGVFSDNVAVLNTQAVELLKTSKTVSDETSPDRIVDTFGSDLGPNDLTILQSNNPPNLVMDLPQKFVKEIIDDVLNSDHFLPCLVTNEPSMSTQVELIHPVSMLPPTGDTRLQNERASELLSESDASEATKTSETCLDDNKETPLSQSKPGDCGEGLEAEAAALGETHLHLEVGVEAVSCWQPQRPCEEVLEDVTQFAVPQKCLDLDEQPPCDEPGETVMQSAAVSTETRNASVSTRAKSEELEQINNDVLPETNGTQEKIEHSGHLVTTSTERGGVSTEANFGSIKGSDSTDIISIDNDLSIIAITTRTQHKKESLHEFLEEITQSPTSTEVHKEDSDLVGALSTVIPESNVTHENFVNEYIKDLVHSLCDKIPESVEEHLNELSHCLTVSAPIKGLKDDEEPAPISETCGAQESGEGYVEKISQPYLEDNLKEGIAPGSEHERKIIAKCGDDQACSSEIIFESAVSSIELSDLEQTIEALEKEISGNLEMIKTVPKITDDPNVQHDHELNQAELPLISSGVVAEASGKKSDQSASSLRPVDAHKTHFVDQVQSTTLVQAKENIEILLADIITTVVNRTPRKEKATKDHDVACEVSGHLPVQGNSPSVVSSLVEDHKDSNEYDGKKIQPNITESTGLPIPSSSENIQADSEHKIGANLFSVEEASGSSTEKTEEAIQVRKGTLVISPAPRIFTKDVNEESMERAERDFEEKYTRSLSPVIESSAPDEQTEIETTSRKKTRRERGLERIIKRRQEGGMVLFGTDLLSDMCEDSEDFVEAMSYHDDNDFNDVRVEMPEGFEEATCSLSSHHQVMDVISALTPIQEDVEDSSDSGTSMSPRAIYINNATGATFSSFQSLESPLNWTKTLEKNPLDAGHIPESVSNAGSTSVRDTTFSPLDASTSEYFLNSTKIIGQHTTSTPESVGVALNATQTLVTHSDTSNPESTVGVNPNATQTFVPYSEEDFGNLEHGFMNHTVTLKGGVSVTPDNTSNNIVVNEKTVAPVSVVSTVLPIQTQQLHSIKASWSDDQTTCDLETHDTENWNGTIPIDINKNKKMAVGVLKEINENILDDTMGAWFSASGKSPIKTYDTENFTKIDGFGSFGDLDFFNHDFRQHSGVINRDSLYVKFDPLYQAHTQCSNDKTIFVEGLNTLSGFSDFIGKNHPLPSSDPHDGLKIEIARLYALHEERERERERKENEFQQRSDEIERQCQEARQALEQTEGRNDILHKRLIDLGAINRNLAAVFNEYKSTEEGAREQLEKQRLISLPALSAVAAERDSYLHHLESAEAAFVDVLTKYDKLRASLSDRKANVAHQEREVLEKRRELARLEELIRASESAAAEELEECRRAMREETGQFSVDAARITAQLRKSELSLKNLQDSLDKTVVSNEQIAALCDDIIAGRS